MLKHAGRIFSSPLQRCKMVGKLISKRFEIPLIVKDILIEMDFGEFQGKTWKQISKEYPKELYEKIMNNNNRLSNGLPIDGNIGYPKGETFSNLLNRTATLFELINPDENTLCITHSQTIKAIIYNARKRRYNILPIYSKDLEGGIIIVSNVDCVY